MDLESKFINVEIGLKVNFKMIRKMEVENILILKIKRIIINIMIMMN